MNQQDLPVRWSKRLTIYLAEKGSEYDQLSASDFGASSNVHLRFDDGSYALFKYAFYLIDEGSNQIAVFTEHCGYHIFPLFGTTIELLESKWSEVEAE